MSADQHARRVRVWLWIFLVCLVLSGLTAFPLETETGWLVDVVHRSWVPAPDGLVRWVDRVHEGIVATNDAYPYLAYGTDWLAFAHLVIAVAFIGPLRDPVRNIWIIQFGMIACAGIIPLALICGPVRGIPLWWTVIDMSFGFFGVIPLWIVYRHIKAMEAVDSSEGGLVAGEGEGSAKSPVRVKIG
jgi:hypothetical protein